MRVVILYCQNAVDINADVETAAGNLGDLTVETVMMACSSKVQASDLLKILNDGADAVEVIACPDKVCRLLVGSRRAEKRIDYARKLLGKIGLDGEMIGFSRKTGLSVEDFIKAGKERAEAVRLLKMKGAKK